MNTVNGRCLCGAVEFQVTLPVKWCAHCHCTMCQRAHGAPIVTWFGVDDGSFSWIRGKDQVRFYKSSAEAERGFCQECGSSLFFRSTRWAGELHISRVAVVDDIGAEPAAHVFFDSHVPWLILGDSLPQLGGPTGTEPIRI
ncbi:MAG: GFA family protein [Polyangiaceae bacterium]|nr:GFA family protein [Polyangiaceae bacterium]